MYNVEGIRWFLEDAGDLRGKSVCDLGNQHIWIGAARYVKTKHDVARDWMLDLGVDRYVSIDNNALDGAIPHDLSKPISDKSLLGKFDIVTNMGTSEHVGAHFRLSETDVLNAQCECMANMFALCRDGGLMIHQVPPVGYWRQHGIVNYDLDFPRALAAACGSTLVRSEMVQLLTLNPSEYLLSFTITKTGTRFAPTLDLLKKIEVNL